MALIRCCACEREVPDRAELCPYCGAEPIKVRSVLTVIVFALMGMVLGALAAAVWHALRGGAGPALAPTSALVLSGACWGAVFGGAAGALFWALFPYKSLQRVPEAAPGTVTPCQCLEGCDGLWE